jgi:hypothetical protein
MRDFPKDGGAKMSEARHGYKMLLDSPETIATPAVRVCGQIYFVDELLRQVDKNYFIPKRYFAKPQVGQESSPSLFTQTEDNLYALGHNVKKIDVLTLCW